MIEYQDGVQTHSSSFCTVRDRSYTTSPTAFILIVQANLGGMGLHWFRPDGYENVLVLPFSVSSS